MARALGEDLRSRVFEGRGRGGIGAPGGGAVRGGCIERDPLDRQGPAGRDRPRPQGRRRGSRLDAQAGFIVEMIEARKDITLDEMVERLLSERYKRIGRSTLSDWLRGRGWTFKNEWPAPLASRLHQALFGRAQTYPA